MQFNSHEYTYRKMEDINFAPSIRYSLIHEMNGNSIAKRAGLN